MAKLLFVAVASLLIAACIGAKLIGAPRRLDIDDVHVNEALKHAMYKLNTVSNDMFVSRPVEVINATMQLVNGIKYDMFVNVGRTKCKKPTTDFSACEFHQNPSLAKTNTCHFVVVNREWLREVDVQTPKCE